MEKQGQFSYWKRRWHRSLVLTLAIIELLSLWGNAGQYRKVREAGVLSAAEWARYAGFQQFKCALNGILAAVLLAVFLIGTLAKSRRAARLAEGVILLLAALAIGGAVLVYRPPLSGAECILALAMLLTAAGAGAFSLFRYRNEKI